MIYHGHCEKLASPNIPNFGLSVFILCGILVSYLPQHIRIATRRSSEGLSPYFILLGTVSATCAFANILVLPTSRADAACCKDISNFACAAALLGIAQIGVQWSCFTVILILFLVFFPKSRNDESQIRSHHDPAKPTWKDAQLVAIISATHFIIVLLISIILIARFPSHLQFWAELLGVGSAILASVQYLPQIWTTWRLQHVLSLSIPMMLIQTPGSYVFAASLAIRLGWAGWSAWGVYIVTGMLQGCLLFMAISFELRDRRQRKANGGVGEYAETHRNGRLTSEAQDEIDERRPLLR